MELLRKLAEFTKLIEDKREIYILYISIILEQSCAVWHSSLRQAIKKLPKVGQCPSLGGGSVEHPNILRPYLTVEGGGVSEGLDNVQH